jgi:hypothetical protein
MTIAARLAALEARHPAPIAAIRVSEEGPDGAIARDIVLVTHAGGRERARERLDPATFAARYPDGAALHIHLGYSDTGPEPGSFLDDLWA